MISSIGNRFQEVVLGGLQLLFYKYGKFVARNPFPVIIFCLLFAGLSVIPCVVDFKEETDQVELWIPRTSEYYKNAKWLAANVPSSKLRFSQALLTTDKDTILTDESIRKLFHIHDNINNVGHMAKLWKDICTKWQNPWTKKLQCAENSLLEIWAKNGSYEDTNSTIWKKTDKEIVDDINTIKKSGIFNFPVKLNLYLGGINKKNSRVEKAKALQMTFQANLDQDGSNITKALEFEQDFIYFLGNYSKENESGPVKIHFFCLKSIQDAIGDTIKGDLSLLSMGFVIVFIYVMVMLGKLNSVEQRAYLSLLGIVAIGLGVATSVGVCQLLGIWYGPMNSILPLLLLGIGIDDMFVIVQGLSNIQKEKAHSSFSVEERIGLAMKHAGVAITITSVTDILAFGISATSVLPVLGNFCAYASLGIFAVFLQMASFFLACLVIDQRRIDARRDAVFCCWKHGEDWKPNNCSQKSYMDLAFKNYAGTLHRVPLKIVIFVLTAALFGVSCYGVSQLEANFDFTDWFPEDSPVVSYLHAKKEHFPSGGISGKVYIAEVPEIEKKLEKIETLITNVNNVQDLKHNKIHSFLPPFFGYLNAKGIADKNFTDQKFRKHLRGFLCTVGRAYTKDVVFVGEQKLNCKDGMIETPHVRMMTFGYQHKSHSGNVLGEFAGYNDVQAAVKSVDLGMNSSSRVFPHAENYNNGLITKIMVTELIRNILLVMVCVFICTLFLIANISMALIVCFTVSITLMDVAGFMQLWGITLDASAAIFLSVAAGLAVDYSAHIAHAFITMTGKSKDERVQKTIIEMGSAVFNGGFSTFLAFSVLMVSRSFLFNVFFKIFFLVVLFGLFHGLVFLPVVLSLIGPPPIATSHMGNNATEPEEKVTELETVESIAESVSATSKEVNGKQ